MKVNRHLIAVIACAVILFVGGILANKAWNSELVQNRGRAYATQKAASAKEHLRQQAEDREKAKLMADCDSQNKFYTTLTPAQKKTTPAPTCQNLQILE